MAQPILASTLFRVSKNRQADNTEQYAESSCADINGLLRGGVWRGRITCISGERGTGKTLIALHILATHLLSDTSFQAAIIDTTGTFDVLRLHQIITSRLRSSQSARRVAVTSTLNPKIFNRDDATDDDVDTSASQALDRVKIMRVFDLEGATEAINELHEDIRNAEKNRELEAAGIRGRTQRTHVADSQADEEDEDVIPLDSTNEDESRATKLEPVSLVLIDNITSVVNPITKKNHVQGQLLLTVFMRSLSLFGKDSNLATILLNNAAFPRQTDSAFPMPAARNGDANLPPSTYIADSLAGQDFDILGQPSIFASTTARPSLGKTLAGLVDCHILLSMVPKRRKDAEIFAVGKSGKAETVNIMEVLTERAANRIGRWAAFEIANGGTELKAPS